jgi:hypothetical protein
MKDVLLDIAKQTSGLTDSLRFSGKNGEVSFKGCDPDKSLFIEAVLKNPVTEFEGEFGLSNINMLTGLLNFSNFKTDDAVFSVKRRERNGVSTVEQFEFRNPVTGNSADFRMMDAALVPQFTIPELEWLVQITPTKSKLLEFTQLSSLYSEINKDFGVKIEKGNLLFFIGDEQSSSHRTSMVFDNNITAELKTPYVWKNNYFTSVMKLAGSHPTTLRLANNKPVMSIVVDTVHGVYTYFIRANQA